MEAQLPLVIETDLGHDADDLWALMYFIAGKAPLRAILLSPGDRYQVCIARSLLWHFDLNVPVLTPKARVWQDKKNAPDGFHGWVVDQLKEGWSGTPDGHEELLPIEEVEAFVCGPAKMSHLLNVKKLTIQGGFVPYSRHRPALTLEKFEGREICPTFNLGGTKPKLVQQLLDKPCEQRFVGKNVCHTVVYTSEIHEKFCPEPKTEAMRLHRLFVEEYIARKGAKAFHDPLAALMSRNHDLGTWMPLKPMRKNGEWGVEESLDGRHQSLVEITDRDAMWKRFMEELNGQDRQN